jgi:hypothetical protein
VRVERRTLMTNTDIWTYGAGDWSSMNVSGYKVEATDGDIGKVDDASYEVGGGYIVVDTGPWILGKKVMLPAGVISRVDASDKKVHVDRTKDEIKSAPEFDAKAYKEREYRDSLGGYYSSRRPM